jgi:hypothetical protein
LGEMSINYAESETLSVALENVKSGDKVVINSVRNEYNKNTSIKEQQEITFADVMIPLDWQYTEFAKVDESDLFE